ncbi:MAG: hypothetical protein PUF50_01760 [Erysipelotrichaceae bacterium]|nr:hypothetical protein [Erysipelotrichaceae bacterium]
MKRLLIVLFIFIMVGCTSSKTNYNKDTKIMICTHPYKSTQEVNGEVLKGTEGIMEDTYWVEDGLLVKHQLTIITPVSDFEDIEEVLAKDLYNFENAQHEFEGLSLGKPYIDGDHYIMIPSIEDYSNVYPYLERGYISKDVLNSDGNAIIFDLYYDKYIVNETAETNPSCTISK